MPGCRELYLPTQATATHEYIGASPACWETFSELLAREFADPAYGAVHRHTVDVYAVQHPGEDGRRSGSRSRCTSSGSATGSSTG